MGWLLSCVGLCCHQDCRTACVSAAQCWAGGSQVLAPDSTIHQPSMLRANIRILGACSEAARLTDWGPSEGCGAGEANLLVYACNAQPNAAPHSDCLTCLRSDAAGRRRQAGRGGRHHAAGHRDRHLQEPGKEGPHLQVGVSCIGNFAELLCQVFRTILVRGGLCACPLGAVGF